MLNSVISSSMTLSAFLICIFSALIMGFLTALVFTGKGKTRLSGTLFLSLTVLPAVVCLVIMLVNGNIGVGLAVAGTFALTRFRSYPGTARDITALFLAVAVGLGCGVGYVTLTAIFLVILLAVVLLITVLHLGETDDSQLRLKITIPEDLDYEGIFDDLLEKYTTDSDLFRVKTTNMGTLFELSYNITLKKGASTKSFMDELRCRNGNLKISISRRNEKEAI